MFQERAIRQLFLSVQEKCSKFLSDLDGSKKFVCSIRIYNGWHTGREPTALRRRFDHIIYDRNFVTDISRTIGRVAFLPEVVYGDQLFGDNRFGTLFNTLRAQGQKMVDTAICADALLILSTGAASAVFIVSDDDDFIPTLIAAETLGYKVYLVRKPGRTLRDVCDVERPQSLCFWE